MKGSEAHFRSLIENASDIITIHQPDGLVIYTSPSTERVFGYRPEEITQQNFSAFVHPDDVAKVFAVFQADQIPMAARIFAAVDAWDEPR